MATIINSRVGERKGVKRIWIEGIKLEREGFKAGKQYSIQYYDSKIEISLNEAGERLISRRKKGGFIIPIIDLNSKKIGDGFQVSKLIRVAISNGKIIIGLHKQENQSLLKDTIEKVAANSHLNVCSLFHGGGVLDKAIHSGLKQTGINSSINVVVEAESKYLDSSIRNNPELWNKDSIIINSPIQLVDLNKNQIRADILIAGIPCTGASRAGRTKNKLWGDGLHPESHPEAGAMVYYYLRFIESLTPSISILECVKEYSSSASMELIRGVLGFMGYHLFECFLEGNQYGALENRKRFCFVAIHENSEFSDFIEISPNRIKEQTVKEILENIPLDDSSWKDFEYLTAKEMRDKAKGNGHKRQLLTGEEDHVKVIGKGYAKCRGSEPFVWDPDSGKSRLLTPIEHCRVKGIPPEVINELPPTTAHEILGQSVIYPAFESLGVSLGKLLKKMALQNKTATAH